MGVNHIQFLYEEWRSILHGGGFYSIIIFYSKLYRKLYIKYNNFEKKMGVNLIGVTLGDEFISRLPDLLSSCLHLL